MTERSSLFRLFAPFGALLACLNIAAGSSEFFERKIRPVLTEHCYECHSASSKKLKGGLRVDGRPELLSGGDTGPAIVPGAPGKSLLLKALSHADPDLAMPPKKARLPDAVIADFERWIREGADWPAGPAGVAAKEAFDLEARKKKQAWLWTAPAEQKLPTVHDAGWPVRPADYFVLQKLEDAGIHPAPPADERTWLRRVHFVICGLPPTPAEIHRFVADPSPRKRERIVDELLASPHFGERWARHWMDLMRYAESRGHESDFIIANAWQYRDYLIRAFNADVPYNQFVAEHVAGDLLPRPRLRPGTSANESVLATGWAFLGEENHSPVDIRGDECERLDNKIDVFSKAFLGLTVACARCHDHKFDPIRSQDYYALSGFLLSSSFRQVRFESEENNRTMAAELDQLRNSFTPRLARALVQSQEPQFRDVAETLRQACALVPLSSGSAPPAERTEARAWLDHLKAAATNSDSPLHLFACKLLQVPDAALPRTAQTPVGAPMRIIADYTRPDTQPWKADGPAFGTRPVRAGELILGDNLAHAIARVMPYGAARRDLFWNRLKNAHGNEDDSGRLGASARAGQMLRTPTVTLDCGKLHYLIRGKTRVYASVDSHLMNEGPLHGVLSKTFDTASSTQPRWVTHDLSAYTGHRVHVEFGPDGPGELEVLMVVEAAETPTWKPELQYQPPPEATTPDALANAFQDAVISAAQELATAQVSPERAVVANWLVGNPQLFRCPDEKDFSSLSSEFLRAQSNLATHVQWESHTAVALFDGTGVDEHVLVRGKPFKPGALAPRSLPLAFPAAHPITCPESSGRTELAQQLIDPANPLVARVMVNRIWHHVFGRGIVATVDNFGELGERPSHPQLLDHLAWQFVHQDHWSIKALIRQLVLSQTFAMSSLAASREVEERDPSNVLLHRMNVRRLEAEVIRDELLAVSGRLSSTVGGPPEPVYLTEFLVGRGRPDKSGPLDGDGRRSVYLAVRRNFLPTFMLTFDSPTPFSTVGRRNVTNVPGQSLALMNDPLFHQQADVWAARLFQEMPYANAAECIQWLFESAYGRLPTAEETAACLQSLNELSRLASGEQRTWAELCHALLNSNEFIYVR